MKALALVCAAVALAACAGGRGRPEVPRPRASDGVPAAQCLLMPLAATDGSLSRAQLDRGIDRLFGEADANRNGGLDQAEVKALNASRKAACDRSPVIDYSGTGHIDRRSFGSRYVTAFIQADTDGNGAISAAEMEAARRPPRKRPPGDRENRTGEPLPGTP